MSRVLAELLGSSEPVFHLWLRGLEKHAGLPGEDIRLVAQVAAESRGKIVELGLDPADTTGKELYAALLSRLAQDELRVVRSLGAEFSDTGQIIKKVADYLNTLEQQSEVLAVKPAVMKSVIKHLKPKQTMKLLGYRSLDSMIRHEPVPQLLAATFIVESDDWHEKRLAEYKKLRPSDFELRAVSFVVPSGKKWPALADSYTKKRHHNMLSVQEAGAVVMLPVQVALPAIAIASFCLAIQSLNDLRASSAYLKLHQVRPDFQEVMQSVMKQEVLGVAKLGESEVSWSVLHWFYGSKTHTSDHPEMFEPHVQPEDMYIHEVEEILTRLDPEVKFWEGTHMLGVIDRDTSEVVSMNMFDVAYNLVNYRRYPERALASMQSLLRRELIGRYLIHRSLHDDAIEQFTEKLMPEFE